MMEKKTCNRISFCLLVIGALFCMTYLLTELAPLVYAGLLMNMGAIVIFKGV